MRSEQPGAAGSAAIGQQTADNGVTLAIQGATSGSVDELTSNTLTLTLLESDPTQLIPGIKFTATVPGMDEGGYTYPDGTVQFGQPVATAANPAISSVTATFTLSPYLLVTGAVPVTLTATDFLGSAASATYTVNVIPEDPPPSVQELHDFGFQEGDPLGSKGHGTESFFVLSLNPYGQPDVPTFKVSSSNTALISNADVSVIPAADSDGYYQLAVNSESGMSGTSTLTVTAVNGTATTSTDIVVSVGAVDVYPVVHGPTRLGYTESSSAQTLSVAFSAAGAGSLGPPSVSVSDPGAPAGWQTPTVTHQADGTYVAKLVLAPDTYASGTLALTATSPGSYGPLVTTDDVTITGKHVHENFSVPATQSFTIAENDGWDVLTGFGSVPVSNPNGDTFSYTIVSGNPASSPTDPTPVYFIANTGRLFVNGPTPYVPGTSNTHVLAIRVSNGAYAHTDLVSVTVADNSPPLLTLTETPTQHPAHGPNITGSISLAATDPHGLGVIFAITNQTDASGAKPYFISGQTRSGGTAHGTILVHADAPIASALDTLTITATDSQGLQTVQDIVFHPDTIVSGGTAAIGSAGQDWAPTGHEWLAFRHG